MSYGDFRGAVARGNKFEATLAYAALPEHMRFGAKQKIERELPEVATLLPIADRLASREVALTWRDPDGERGEDVETVGLWWIDGKKWELCADGVVIASHKTLDLHPLQRAWACGVAWHCLHRWEGWASEHASEHLDAPRKAIEVAWAHLHGNATDDELDAAWAAARNAARNAARDAAWAAAWAAARNAEHDRLNEWWSLYVLEHVLTEGR